MQAYSLACKRVTSARALDAAAWMLCCAVLLPGCCAAWRPVYCYIVYNTMQIYQPTINRLRVIYYNNVNRVLQCT